MADDQQDSSAKLARPDDVPPGYIAHACKTCKQTGWLAKTWYSTGITHKHFGPCRTCGGTGWHNVRRPALIHQETVVDVLTARLMKCPLDQFASVQAELFQERQRLDYLKGTPTTTTTESK